MELQLDQHSGHSKNSNSQKFKFKFKLYLLWKLLESNFCNFFADDNIHIGKTVQIAVNVKTNLEWNPTENGNFFHIISIVQRHKLLSL